jgi:hypothetical protein
MVWWATYGSIGRPLSTLLEPDRLILIKVSVKMLSYNLRFGRRHQSARAQ